MIDPDVNAEDRAEWKDKLERLYPVAKKSKEPGAANHHLAALIMVLIFDEEMLEATFPTKTLEVHPEALLGPDSPYPFLVDPEARNHVSAEDVLDIAKHSGLIRQMHALWAGLTGVYENGACPTRDKVQTLVEFTKTFEFPRCPDCP